MIVAAEYWITVKGLGQDIERPKQKDCIIEET